ncbi:MAG: hypothetical protein ACFE9O_02170 [Promethearchaeota archaeon]
MSWKLLPVFFQVGTSLQEAKQQLLKWGKPLDESRAILGAPSDCLARINEYAKAGATHRALQLVHPSKMKYNIKTIAQEIMPNL